MRLFLFLMLLLFLSCSENGLTTAPDDSVKIVSISPASDLYIDLGGVDTVYLVLSATRPLHETDLSYTLSSEDTLITEETLKSWITVTLPDLSLSYIDSVYEDTIAIPISVSATAQQTIGTKPYALKFKHRYGTKEHNRSLRFHVAPFIDLQDLMPRKDTLDTLLLPDVDTFTLTVKANTLLSPNSVSVSFRRPNNKEASDLLSAEILPFVPAESVACTLLVSLLSVVDVQGDYTMHVEATNASVKDLDSVKIYIEGPDIITIDELILEADRVSPGGQLEGEFSYSANKLMSRSDVSFLFTDLALNPVTTISGHAHGFQSFFSGRCEYDINVGANTPIGSYIYHIIMTNDSLSDTLSGTIQVAEGVVEHLDIISITPNPLTMYKKYGQMKATFLISSSKFLTTRNSFYNVVDTSDSSVLDMLEQGLEYIEEDNGLYKSTLLLKPKDTLPEGQYYLKYGCALDSVGDTVSIPLTVAPFSIDIGDIPNQVIAKGETVQLAVTFSGSAVFELHEFFSEVTVAGKSAPSVTFLSFADGILTFSVAVPEDALVTDADIYVGIGGYKEYFKVSIVEP